MEMKREKDGKGVKLTFTGGEEDPVKVTEGGGERRRWEKCHQRVALWHIKERICITRAQ